MSATFDLAEVRVWPGDKGAVLERGYVSIRDGLIAGVGRGRPARPATMTIELPGHTVIPGLVDAHVHLTTVSSHMKPVDNAQYRALTSEPTKLLHGIRNAMRALAAGFTTLRVMGHRGVGEPELREFIDEGLLIGPRLLVAPWVISMTGGRGDLFWPATIVRDQLDTADGVDEIRKMVRLQRKRGADFIKVTASGGNLSGGDKPYWPNYTQAELAALVEESHDYELRVAAHAHSAEGVRRAVRAGVDTIEHGSFIDRECIDLMLENGTYLVPTLAIGEWVMDRGVQGSVNAEGLAKIERARERHHESFREALDAGVPIVMGTDSTGTIAPFGHHARELELYVELGMSPADALRAATSTAARALGIDKEQGVIAAGKVADLIIVEGDPLKDITLLRRGGVRKVYRRGVDVTDPWPLVNAAMRDEGAFFQS
jgi:imidazolonepropionase-like amidohydrolase